MVINIYAPDLIAISLLGSGNFTTIDPLITPQFTAHITGSGTMEIQGTADSLDVNLSGSGSFKGLDYQVTKANINLSGSGSISIAVETMLQGRITGSGNISYKGSPTTDVSIEGSGRLSQTR